MPIRTIVAVCLLIVGSLEASACYAPSFSHSEPSAPGSYSKPDVPYCFHNRSCEQWEVDSYISEVEDYIDKLKDYANDAVDFSNAARSFAEEVTSYAKCEADEVVDQHR